MDEPPIMISTDEEQDTVVLVPQQQRSSDSTRSVPELEIHSRMRSDTHPYGHVGEGSSTGTSNEGFCSSCRRHRYLVPGTQQRRQHAHCSRCESVSATQWSGDSLSRHASKDSIRSVHLADSYLTKNVSKREGPIRRQHSQPESTCLHCQTHR